jgi:hypothetical protein
LSFVTGIGIFSTIYLTPLFLGYVRGFSAWQTGIAIFSTGAASLIGVPIYILVARKFDIRWFMMLGLGSFALSMWSFSFITHDWGADQLLIPQILRGLPQVFAVAPAVNLGLGSPPPDRLKYASGLFNMMRNLGGAVGIAVSGAIFNANTNFHFVAIASNLTPANGAMTRFVDGMVEWSATARFPAAPMRVMWPRSSPCGSSPTAKLPRHLCGCVPRHHDHIGDCHPLGAAPAQSRTDQRSRIAGALILPRDAASAFASCGLSWHPLLSANVPATDGFASNRLLCSLV